MKKRIKDFEHYTKVQHFGDGFTQWTDEHLTHSSRVCVNDTHMTRALVRSAFKANWNEISSVCFSRDDAINQNLEY